jgi:hypothetical protein
VPAGHTWIVKEIALLSNSAAPDLFIVQYGRGTASTAILNATVRPLQTVLMDGLFGVLVPGDQLTVVSLAGGPASWWISGADLLGVAP